MKQWISAMAIVALFSGAGVLAAQDGAKDDTKKAGHAIKEAGKDTGSAAKHAGKATAKATKKGASKVKDAVTDRKTLCVDGTEQKGDSAAAACAGHGGVK